MPNNANIDERVVEMRIDNRQFVDGAEKTISILDRLKEALTFKKAGDGFAEVQNAANKVDLSGMATNIEKISSRFSDMGIVGQRVIQNLTDSVYGFVKNTITGLTIDPVQQGFGKYEEILQKTQVIMSATMNEDIPARFGSQLEYVEHELEMAAWYTDETSASLTDIVSNVSKFTNVGVPLQDALYDMQGIANWGWSAGASVQEMSRAMYNLSQAMSVGSVKLMDWRSIENANMGTLEFKQTAIDTAVALGTLIDVGDGLYQTLEGNAVSAKNFNDALKDEWFTADVLEQTLRIYGDYSRRLGEVMNDMGLSDAGLAASDVMDAIDGVVEAVEKGSTVDEALAAWQEELSSSFTEDTLPSIDQLRYAFQLLTGDEDALAEHAKAVGGEWEKLSKEQFELAKRAFLMGQEYKTFGDVVDATKDAVSTGWMKTFKLIIGNAEEAKEFWTEVGGVFYDIFAASAARRNAILKWWNTAEDGLESGRDALLRLTDDYPSALGNLLRAVESFVKPITTAFNNIFSWGAAKEAGARLRELTYRIRDFLGNLSLTESAQRGMTNFFSAIFRGVKRVLQVLKPVTSFIGSMIVTIKDAINLFFESFDNESGKFDKSRFLSGLPDIFKNVSENVSKAWNGLKKFFSSFSDVPIVRSVFGFIASAFSYIADSGKTIIDYLTTAKEGLEDAESPVQKIKDWFSKIWDYVKNIDISTDALREGFGKVGEVVQTLYSGLTGDEGDFKERIKAMLDTAIQAIKEKLSEISFSDIMEGARLGIMGYTAIQFAQFVTSFKKTADSFKSIPEAITGTFESLSKTIESYGKAQNATTMLKMAGAILMVAAAILVLSKIPDDKFAAIAVTLAFFFTVLSKIAKSISSTKNFADNKNNLFVKILPDWAAGLIAAAAILGVAAYALAKLSNIEPTNLVKGFIAIVGVLIAAVISLAFLSNRLDKDTNVKALGKLIAIAAIISATGKAFERVKDLSWGQILAAAFGLAMVISAVALVMYTAKDLSAGNGVGAILTLLSVVIVLNGMIPVFMLFSSFNWEQFGIVMLSVIIVVGAIAGLMFVISKVGAGGALKGAAAMLVVGASFVLFSIALGIAAPAILAFGSAIVALMNIFAATTDIFPKLLMLAAFGVALIPLGIGLEYIAKAVLIFSAALLVGSVAFGIFGVALLAIASGITMLTAVLLPFGSVLIEFCNMIAENGKILVGIVSTIILSVLTAILMHKVKIAYSVVAVILAVVGAIVENGPAILQSLAQILEQVLLFLYQLIPMLIKFLVASVIFIINGVADTLRANKAALISAIENLISVILELVVETFFRMIGDLFGGLWSLIAGLFGEDDGSVGREISNWLAGIGEGASGIINKVFGGEEREAAKAGGEGIVGSLTEGVQSASEQVPGVLQECLVDPVDTAATEAGDAAAAEGENVLSKFAQAAGLSAPGVTEQMGAMFGNVAESADMSDQGATYGSNFITSIGNAAIQEGPWLNDTLAQLAANGSAAFSNTWQINSPSKVGERLGRFWDLGVVKGLEGGSGDIDDTSNSMANRMNEAMQTAMANIALLSQEDFSISPVITPVVDMTNVESASQRASELFSNQGQGSGRTGNISRNMASAEAAASNMQAASEVNNISQDQITVNVYGTDNMDEQALADLVIQQLMDNLARKGASLG